MRCGGWQRCLLCKLSRSLSSSPLLLDALLLFAREGSAAAVGAVFVWLAKAHKSAHSRVQKRTLQLIEKLPGQLAAAGACSRAASLALDNTTRSSRRRWGGCGGYNSDNDGGCSCSCRFSWSLASSIQ